MRASLLTFLFFLLSGVFHVVFSQSESTDFMRSIGKMYVVVAVVVVIFLLLVLFLIAMERRITKLENQIKNHG